MFFPTEEHRDIAQSFLNALDGIGYLVDGAGVVVATSASWDEFALGNEGEQACGACVAGADMFAGMVGADVRTSYARIHKAVLAGESPFVAFDYRCDAPDVRRQLRMSVRRISLPRCEMALLYQSQLLSAVARPWMSLFEPQRIVEYMRSESGVPIIRMCSFCQRVAWPALPDDQPPNWLEADDYYRDGGPSDVRISHGVCADCHAVHMEKIDGDGHCTEGPRNPSAGH